MKSSPPLEPLTQFRPVFRPDSPPVNHFHDLPPHFATSECILLFVSSESDSCVLTTTTKKEKKKEKTNGTRRWHIMARWVRLTKQPALWGRKTEPKELLITAFCFKRSLSSGAQLNSRISYLMPYHYALLIKTMNFKKEPIYQKISYFQIFYCFPETVKVLKKTVVIVPCILSWHFCFFSFIFLVSRWEISVRVTIIL